MNQFANVFYSSDFVSYLLYNTKIMAEFILRLDLEDEDGMCPFCASDIIKDGIIHESDCPFVVALQVARKFKFKNTK
jgi:hypothetical protein